MRLNLSEPGRQNRTFEGTSSALSAWRLNLTPMSQARGVSLLLISTAFAEVASNVVYVVLVERAYQLGNGAAAIGIVLILQAAAQVIFGSWAGGIADQKGFRKAASMAALLTTPLVLALAFAQSIWLVYILAFLFMLARLLLIPARFGLVAQLSDKSGLAEANTAILIIAGVGSFVHMERVAEVHMKAREARPISPEAARYARADLTRYGAGRVAFWSLVARHIGDPDVVLD